MRGRTACRCCWRAKHPSNRGSHILPYPNLGCFFFLPLATRWLASCSRAMATIRKFSSNFCHHCGSLSQLVCLLPVRIFFSFAFSAFFSVLAHPFLRLPEVIVLPSFLPLHSSLSPPTPSPPLPSSFKEKYFSFPFFFQFICQKSRGYHRPFISHHESSVLFLFHSHRSFFQDVTNHPLDGRVEKNLYPFPSRNLIQESQESSFAFLQPVFISS